MDKIKLQVDDWKNSNIQVFWGEIAPNQHSVQVYENDKSFFDTLEGFVGCGFLSGDSVIIIATPSHIELLNERLRKQGFDLETMSATDQYITLDANEVLSKFMVNDWPDEKLFNDEVTQIISRAKKNDRKVRAFGEMVALLWEQGLNGATVYLENLWHELHRKKSFTIYCAYPKSGFTQDVNHSIDTICKTHSKVIDGQERPSTEIYYRNVS
jgi:MEDS: MEthanogen/methylotroph, DcmR Sensory domain